MSVTFHSNVTTKTVTEKLTPCLCAQMAESFSPAMDGNFDDAVKADLAANANPACPFCHGSGVELMEESDAPSLNLANDNAMLLLQVLGLQPEFYGEMGLAQARRAVMRARSRSDLTPFTREDETVHGRPRTNEDGSVELRPLRVHTQGVTMNRLESYIDRFAAFVEESASRGATEIHWG
jgi:hypothetical protein